MEPAPLGAELWLADLALLEPALEALEQKTRRLSHDDLDRIARFASAGQRRDRRLSYLALRVLLERHFGVRARGVAFERGRNGKPSLSGLAGDFSLAHTSGLALIGLAPSGRIGVDLETARNPSLPNARREKIERAAAALSPAQSLPEEQPSRFLTAWARLEALGKADGRGVGYVLGALGAWGERREGLEHVSSGGGMASQYAEPIEAAFQVANVDAGKGLFAAVSVNVGRPLPSAVTRLPAGLEDLERLLMPH